MKPHRLILRAFGPFVRQQTVDFDLLPEDALFLIHGPTGAGKSTLLDGLCYALYGVSSGGERQAKELRSHAAAADQPTEVSLEFSLGMRRYQVWRAPEQVLSGRGGVLRVRPAQALLALWQDGAWQPLAERPSDVTARIQALIGFQADQFRQVIMLPQGQFRRLLAANSREREEILTTLFASTTCRRLQEALNGAARALQTTITEKDSQRAALLQQAAVADEAALQEWLSTNHQTLSALSEEEMAQRVRDEAARQALIAGEALAARFAELADAQVAWQKLHEQDTLMASERQRLNLARRAQNVLPAWISAQEARQRLAAAQDTLQQTSDQAQQAAKKLAQAVAVLAAEQGKATQREAAAVEIQRLQAMQNAVAAWRQASEVHAAAQQKSAALSQNADQLAHEHAKITARQNQIEARIANWLPLAAGVQAQKLAVAQSQAHLALVRRLTESEQALHQARQHCAQQAYQLNEARAARDTAQGELTALQARWRAAQAVVLARHLHDGQPCPVCGSCAHPQPATANDSLPDEDSLQEATARLRQQQDALEQARAQLEQDKAKVSAIEAALQEQRATLALPADAPLPSVEASAAALAEAERRAAEAQQASRELTEQQALLDQCRQQEAALRHTLEATRQALAEAQAATAASKALWQEREAQVPPAWREPQRLAQTLAATQAEQQRLQQALEQAQQSHLHATAEAAAARASQQAASNALQEAEGQCRAAEAALAEALQRHGFADQAAFTAAQFAEADLAALEERLHQYETACSAALARLERARGAVEGHSPPQLDALREAQQQTQAALEEIQRRRHLLSGELAAKERSAKLLDALAEERRQLAERYRVAGHLAAIAGGDNPAKLTFQRYVLATVLDEVLHQASLRLRRMTGQRYALQRALDASNKGRAGGLDIEVFDEQTGTMRSVQTLSGGEGFLASLALALGLADVVQNTAGGIQLDTLFIDEGFGTLDSEALDMALHALIELRHSGRRVGIISHVEELKHQIAWGIAVSGDPSGSQVRVVRIGAAGQC